MRRAAFYKNRAAMAEEDDDEEEEDEDEEEEEEVEEEELENKRIRGVSSMSLMPTRKGGMSSSSGTNPSCQADNCPADMAEAKRYHKRHKVCEFHAKAPVVLVAGLQQRFCQQCSRFHEISEFDEAKRSCRRRLAGHNERRRKSSYDLHGEGSN